MRFIFSKKIWSTRSIDRTLVIQKESVFPSPPNYENNPHPNILLGRPPSPPDAADRRSNTQ